MPNLKKDELNDNYKGIPEWVWHPGLGISPGARLVLIWYIYNGILETGWVQLKQEYVAKSCGISLRTLCAKQREMEKASLIRVIATFKSAGGFGPNKVLLLRKPKGG
jgi:hypothetical protein